MTRKILLRATALGFVFAGLPALAEHQGHGSHGGSGGGPAHSGGFDGHGSPNGNAHWQDFQHHEAPVRVYPHRFQGSVFPAPHSWHGDVHVFDRDHWHGGEWRHTNHNGRWGWWWVVGPEWYDYDTPIYPSPDSYTPPGERPGWWYWCDAYQEYYPYVTICPGGWQRVLPRD